MNWKAVSMVLALGVACAPPESIHRDHVQSIQMWKDQCGLLWIVDTDPMINLDIRVTGRDGQMVEYGNGTIFDNKHLISSFCRSQWTSTKRFNLMMRSRDGIAISGTIEAWYNGKLLNRVPFDRTATFQTTLSIEKEKLY